MNVRVGGYVAPPWEKVPTLMGQWLREHAYLDPFEAHCRFERIHPFVDGNGRTGRMLLWWQQVRAGDEPLLIEAVGRFAYYAQLETR